MLVITKDDPLDHMENKICHFKSQRLSVVQSLIQKSSTSQNRLLMKSFKSNNLAHHGLVGNLLSENETSHARSSILTTICGRLAREIACRVWSTPPTSCKKSMNTLFNKIIV